MDYKEAYKVLEAEGGIKPSHKEFIKMVLRSVYEEGFSDCWENNMVYTGDDMKINLNLNRGQK